MLRSTTFDNLLSNCTHIEQIIDLCGRALYDAYPSIFLQTGFDNSGEDILSQQINHWTGSQIIGVNQAEEQIVISFNSTVDKAHKASATPWLYTGLLGSATDTPNGIYA